MQENGNIQPKCWLNMQINVVYLLLLLLLLLLVDVALLLSYVIEFVINIHNMFQFQTDSYIHML